MAQTRILGDGSADEAEDGNDTMDLDPQPGGGFVNQLAKKLVRYALSCEFSRTPIRRQGIREKGKYYEPWVETTAVERQLTQGQFSESTHGRSRRSLHSPNSS